MGGDVTLLSVLLLACVLPKQLEGPPDSGRAQAATVESEDSRDIPDDLGEFRPDPLYNPCGASMDDPAVPYVPVYDYWPGFSLGMVDYACDGEDWPLIASSYDEDEGIEADAITVQVWDALTGLPTAEYAMAPPEPGEPGWRLTLTPEQAGVPCGAPGVMFTAQPSRGADEGAPDGGFVVYGEQRGVCIREISLDQNHTQLFCDFDDADIDAAWIWQLFPPLEGSSGPYFMTRYEDSTSWQIRIRHDNSLIPGDPFGSPYGLVGCRDSEVAYSYAF